MKLYETFYINSELAARIFNGSHVNVDIPFENLTNFYVNKTFLAKLSEWGFQIRVIYAYKQNKSARKRPHLSKYKKHIRLSISSFL